MTDTQVSLSLPQATQALADGLASLVITIKQNAKPGVSLMEQLPLDVTAAVAALVPALANLGALGGELKSEPLGVAEAFVIAGFKVAQGLK